MRLSRVSLALFLLVAAALAQEEKRVVLAIVPGAKPDPHVENQAHAVLECPLNHLGMVVRYHYVESGPPPRGCLDDARALLTWFDFDTADADWLWSFLEKEVAPRRIRVVHFGHWGPLGRDPERLAAWLARFGLEHQGIHQIGPFGIDVSWRSRALCAMEADPRLHTIHTGPRSTGARNRVWVTTSETGADPTVCHPVVTGPWGAVALDPWTVRKGSDDQDRRWHLDPFAFFREALGLDRVPAPHPAVLNGRRMWFLHVDGDGFESLSSLERGAYAAKVMKDRVFERYELPFTASIVVRSLTPDIAVEEPTPAMALAREILALPNVEPASHGVLHALEWRQEWKGASPPRTMIWYADIRNYRYSAVNEVRESIRFINERLLTSPKRCALMLWTGNANPLEDAILASYEAGCLNLNGGVFRWDRWHDSVAYVSPWSRRVGRSIQVYAGAANENDLDGYFDTMPGSFRHIDQTIQRTGSPRILKPANIYIHYYSAEKRARLDPVHDLIRRWTREEPTAPVFASTYVRAVLGAVETARIHRTPNGWRFRSFGGCRSVRIEDEPRAVDLARSRGVLGSLRRGNRLWIHLAGPEAEVVLADAVPLRPYVEEANCVLEDAALGESGVSVTARAHNPRVVVFAGFAANADVALRIGETERRTRADKAGRVAVRLPEAGRTRIVAGLPR